MNQSQGTYYSLFHRLEEDLARSILRTRTEQFSPEETKALGYVLRHGTQDQKYTVKEMMNEVLQLKNSDWFE